MLKKIFIFIFCVFFVTESFALPLPEREFRQLCSQCGAGIFEDRLVMQIYRRDNICGLSEEVRDITVSKTRSMGNSPSGQRKFDASAARGVINNLNIKVQGRKLTTEEDVVLLNVVSSVFDQQKKRGVRAAGAFDLALEVLINFYVQVWSELWIPTTQEIDTLCCKFASAEKEKALKLFINQDFIDAVKFEFEDEEILVNKEKVEKIVFSLIEYGCFVDDCDFVIDCVRDDLQEAFETENIDELLYKDEAVKKVFKILIKFCNQMWGGEESDESMILSHGLTDEEAEDEMRPDIASATEYQEIQCDTLGIIEQDSEERMEDCFDNGTETLMQSILDGVDTKFYWS